MKKLLKVIALPLLASVMLLPVVISVNKSISKKNVTAPVLTSTGQPYPYPTPPHKPRMLSA
jgi:hypothetical protein